MDEGIGESEIEELVPEWGWRETKGADSKQTCSIDVRKFLLQ